MKSIKFYKILSITLLILNLVTLSIFFISGPPGPPRPGEAYLAEEIGMTGSTKKTVDALEIKHHKDKRALKRKNFELQKKLYNSLTDEEQSAEIMLQIHENRMKTERMTFEFFREVASYCNKKQRKKLDESIDHGLRRITGNGGPPPKR